MEIGMERLRKASCMRFLRNSKVDCVYYVCVWGRIKNRVKQRYFVIYFINCYLWDFRELIILYCSFTKIVA